MPIVADSWRNISSEADKLRMRSLLNGSFDMAARVDLIAEATEFAAKGGGTPHAACFAQRARKNMKREGLLYFAAQKSA